MLHTINIILFCLSFKNQQYWSTKPGVIIAQSVQCSIKAFGTLPRTICQYFAHPRTPNYSILLWLCIDIGIEPASRNPNTHRTCTIQNAEFTAPERRRMNWALYTYKYSAISMVLSNRNEGTNISMFENTNPIGPRGTLRMGGLFSYGAKPR
jgi:hypothetical protein